MNYAKEFFPSFHAICDIGCANGNFLMFAKKQGFSVAGIDINPNAVRSARAMGINAFLPQDVNKKQLELLNKPILFTMRQVIEHVRSIKELIDWLNNLVDPPWGLIIETPNCYSWCAEAVQYNHKHFHGWGHLQILSKRSMKILARDFNMNLIKAETYSYGFGLRSWLQTRFTPWMFDNFSSESIKRWPQNACPEYDGNKLNHKVREATKPALRSMVGYLLRYIDKCLDKLKPGGREYIRAVFLRSN